MRISTILALISSLLYLAGCSTPLYAPEPYNDGGNTARYRMPPAAMQAAREQELAAQMAFIDQAATLGRAATGASIIVCQNSQVIDSRVSGQIAVRASRGPRTRYDGYSSYTVVEGSTAIDVRAGKQSNCAPTNGSVPTKDKKK